MDNCKDLNIFIREMDFLMDRMHGNIKALHQIRSENNTEELRIKIDNIQWSILATRIQMDLMYQEITKISKNLDKSEEIDH